jgi:catechol 2,3-dioxygenase-like lactoylglutathione lyase family enzyme
MALSVDHIVILVEDLEQAIADYQAAGFNAFYGGEHSDGSTHNALVIFEDGAYLELIAFKRDNEKHRWHRHRAHGPGLVDYALSPDSAAAVIAAARERGLELNGPTPGGRKRPDGQEVRWEIGSPLSDDLPFLCGDVTPRALRVPEGEVRKQANGVGGVAAIAVAVKDPAASSARYAALLGQEAQNNIFNLGECQISLHGANDPAAAARLATRGEGIFRLSLRAPVTLSLDKALLHGADIH